MFGAAPKTVYVVFSSPLPGQEARYEQWYDEIHVPDSLAMGIFHHAHRYAAVGPSEAAFMTVWESEYADIREALARVRPTAERFREQGRIWPVQKVFFHQFLFLEDHDPQPGATRGVTSLMGCWAAAGADSDFRGWLQALDAETAARLEAYCARYVYAAALPGGGGRSLVLLESELEPELLGARWRGDTQAGLPPFGEPTPIFEDGGPQAYAEPRSVGAEQLARWQPAWAAHWRPVHPVADA